MEFSHIDGKGEVRMVDVSGKPVVRRTAVAAGNIRMNPDTIAKLKDGLLEKGDALATARIAGITAAKRTGHLIPLCHPLPIDSVKIDFTIEPDGIGIRSEVTSTARTGVEMEALTAVSVAALSLYDMCKAVDKGMVIGDIRLESKKKEPA
jgi:cyclic pyranopterin phosphate synthase